MEVTTCGFNFCGMRHNSVFPHLEVYVNMKKIRVIGWEVGFRKVSFTQLLMDYDFSLNDAKKITDKVLDNRDVSVWVEESRAHEFIERAAQLQVSCEIEIQD